MFEHVALCRVLNDLWFDKLHVILWFSSFIRLFISLSKLDSHSDGITQAGRQAGTFATTNSLEWKSFRLAKATFALFGWGCYKMNKWIHIFLTIYVAAAATDGVDPWKKITRWAPQNIWRGVSTSSFNVALISFSAFMEMDCLSVFTSAYQRLCMTQRIPPSGIWFELLCGERGVRFNVAWPNDYVDDW